MALITCPDCGKAVSDTAVACPSCARPMRAQTIEQTGKSYKSAKVIGVLMVLVGLLCVAFSPALGALLAFTGGVLYIGATAGAYWANG